MVVSISFKEPSLPVRAPESRIQARAAELETAFLSEILGYSGLFAAETEFSGGPGAAQFASFLRDEYARGIVGSGGLGLGRAFVDAMWRGQTHGN
ncbi:chemotaxis protein chel [Gemmobacter lutimaris]|uniref:Chemotaxis protein chel n=1 Tax=Gemmobacter lutimaris TaxID=2306023 RepID=A0A398BPA9_9RHOB|nr:chemotaxis protein chel [Gemmobacter lutimaris]RID90741.1 chemotaxis protein chel [Gemmobacter lutimaris]